MLYNKQNEHKRIVSHWLARMRVAISLAFKDYSFLLFYVFLMQYELNTPLLFLDHLHDKRVDLLGAVASIAALVEVEKLLLESAVGGRELEWPEKVGGFLEVGADSEDLVNEILAADDVLLAKDFLDNLVIGDGDALLVDLAKAPLVHESPHGLEGWGSRTQCRARRGEAC